MSKISIGDTTPDGYIVIGLGIPFSHIGAESPMIVALLQAPAITPDAFCLAPVRGDGLLGDYTDMTDDYGQAWENFADACA